MKVKERYEDFIIHLRAEGKTEKTITEYRRFLFGSMSHSIQDMELDELTLNDSVKVREAGTNHGQFGAQRSIVTFRRYLRFLKNGGIKIPFDWRDVEVPKVPERDPDALTIEELEMVMSSINMNKMGFRQRALMETIYSTGMRISEVLSLTKEQVPWIAKELKIVNAKTKRIEKVYFTDRCLFWLDEYIKRRTDSCPHVFVAYHGYGAVKKGAARAWLREHFKEIGLKLGKRITHPLLRRTFVTHLIEGGANIKAVQYLARHLSERTTLKNYTAVNKDKAKEVHSKILDQNPDYAMQNKDLLGLSTGSKN